MTWYVGHIFAEPIEPVIKALSSIDVFREHMYHVTDLIDYDWHTPEIRHGLPNSGLLVVREVCKPGYSDPEWHGGDAIELSSESTVAAPLEMQVLIPPVPETRETADWFPPIGFLQFLKWVSVSTNTVVSYFYCCTWAGDIDDSYGWVFGADEVVYLYNEEGPVTRYTESGADISSMSVLRSTLQHHGLNLPTEYFALHTRSFPWSKYKLNT